MLIKWGNRNGIILLLAVMAGLFALSISCKKEVTNIIYVTMPATTAGATMEIPVPKADGQDVPVSFIKITLAHDTSGGRVSVMRVSEPSEVVAPSENVYAYLEITADELSGDDIETVGINFDVPTSWLSENGIDEMGVAMYRQVNDSWTALITDIVSKSETLVSYEATSAGLSQFAIASAVGPTNTRIGGQPSSIELGETFEIAIEAKNWGDTASIGGISISFPKLDERSSDKNNYSKSDGRVEILRRAQGYTTETNFYAPGGGRNVARKQTVGIDPSYLLVEVQWNDWKANAEKFVRLSITPSEEGTFPINIRTWVCETLEYQNCVYDPHPNDPDGVTGDQQIWKVF